MKKFCLFFCFIFFLLPLVSCTSRSNGTKDSDTVIYEETVSPNESYVSVKEETVYYHIKIYQKKDNTIVVVGDSNSAFFDKMQYELKYDKTISKSDVSVVWMTLMGNQEATKEDQIAYAGVSISSNGEIFSERKINFLEKGIEIIVDTINDSQSKGQNEAILNTPKQSPVQSTVIDQSVVTDPAELRKIQNRCSDIIELCQDLLLNAETETSEYFPYETTLTQRAVDQIESSLANAGYPVINTDDYYPRYLENSEGISRFGESISNNITDELEIISVSRWGHIYHCLFQYSDGQMAYIHTTISAGENNQLDIDKTIIEKALDWGMTPKGDFYYQIQPLNGHWDAYILIREKPVSKELHDLVVKYVYPIGYRSNNMFLTNWSDSDFGKLCFNDLFEYLYRQQNGDYFYPDDFDFRFNSDMCCYMIPSALFEQTIMPFLNVSIDELRKRTLYDTASDTYPWQVVGASNIVYYPTITPEVVDYRENDDGTFTLTVDVMCFDMKEYPLFTHEVTIRPCENGEYQYLSNNIIYQCGRVLPPSFPRLEAQRSKDN